MKMTEGDPYSNLANEIVIQAAKDYVAALKKVKRNRSNAKAQKDLQEIEDFFHSRWYGELTSVSPEYLIRELRKKVDE